MKLTIDEGKPREFFGDKQQRSPKEYNDNDDLKFKSMSTANFINKNGNAKDNEQ